MRKLILFIVIGLAGGALLGQLMLSVPGYWLIRVGDTSVQTSFWFGLLLLFALFLVFHFVLRALWRLRRPISRMRRWNAQNRNSQAMRRTVQGLVALAEGRWKRAEKALTRAARDSSTPLVNYLSAALAAHYQGRYEQSEALLRQAHGSTENADSAVSLVQAQLMLDRQQHEQALATLTRLEQQLPEHPQVLKLLKQAYLGVGDWEGIRRLLPRLERHRLVGEDERADLERRTYRALMRQASQSDNELERVRTLWSDLPDHLTGDVELILIYVGALQRAGDSAQAERLLRQSLKSHWDTRLIHHYGTLEVDPNRQLVTAEKWLQERPNDPELLMTLGRLSLRNAYWGKAQEYFEASHRQRPSGEVCAELARLYANLGEHSKSQFYYRKSVELLDRSLPALPQPSEHTR
ncbi:heme biosynthesis protein HemY [Kushneria phosphatilytica]|uniref:Heme biosynthesis protein HemY n=1 Tax=Kushneria phosphatilytica TaxID=657387 RepID=A0A1S1NSW4_9GAMM|nr:heme biosynthesis HemY N-terminal domain-containing protein [Kushneria phosphatilytica]OHV08382.1 heme biosynthesis protein HemY [Kushneria phosphatilytica]QEL09804.1 heme biosynthesis protein HemY [Kushneria phosphatilytica]